MSAIESSTIQLSPYVTCKECGKETQGMFVGEDEKRMHHPNCERLGELRKGWPDIPKPPEELTLDQFRQYLNNKASEFTGYYLAHREKDEETPENWPLKMPEEEWFEQFLVFLGFRE